MKDLQNGEGGNLGWVRMEFAPSNPSIAYSPKWEGIYKSYNGGDSWIQTTSFSTAIDPTNEQVVYVGTENEDVYKTVDGGDSWSNISDGIPIGDEQIIELTIAESTPQTIYAVVSREGVY